MPSNHLLREVGTVVTVSSAYGALMLACDCLIILFSDFLSDDCRHSNELLLSDAGVD